MSRPRRDFADCPVVAGELGAASQVKSSQVRNYSPGYMEQAPSRGHGASPQSGLGVGCMLCSSSKELRGLSVRAQARRISISLLFSVLGFSSLQRTYAVYITNRDMDPGGVGAMHYCKALLWGGHLRRSL